jgi:hypothetical protein
VLISAAKCGKIIADATLTVWFISNCCTFVFSNQPS